MSVFTSRLKNVNIPSSPPDTFGNYWISVLNNRWYSDGQLSILTGLILVGVLTSANSTSENSENRNDSRYIVFLKTLLSTSVPSLPRASFRLWCLKSTLSQPVAARTLTRLLASRLEFSAFTPLTHLPFTSITSVFFLFVLSHSQPSPHSPRLDIPSISTLPSASFRLTSTGFLPSDLHNSPTSDHHQSPV